MRVNKTEDNQTSHDDLEDRTDQFAKSVREFVKKIPKTLSNNEDGKHLMQSSGSVGATYTEANESLSKKDIIFMIKVCRKGVNESRYWPRLIHPGDKLDVKRQRESLEQEATELTNIFGAVFRKCE